MERESLPMKEVLIYDIELITRLIELGIVGKSADELPNLRQKMAEQLIKLMDT